MRAITKIRSRALAAGLISTAVLLASPALALKGAIFTTVEDGTIVNENVRYEAKEDVYLDGGPGPNAPASAASLPEGDYYFQVTDPSGKDLLSSDHISCRKIHVNEHGVIDHVYPGTNYVRVKGSWVGEPCQHEQGVDADHYELGAITVQLYPYDDTPNPGGVYKAWVTPVGAYTLDPAASVPAPGAPPHFDVNGELWQPGNFHGFLPSQSKTDNYKVREKGKPFDPPLLRVRKFHDRNANGVQDPGDEDVAGWKVTITDPTDVSNDAYTPAEVLTADAGQYRVVEDQPAGTLQTAAFLDGVALAVDPTVYVDVAGESGEIHEVVYGNVGLGSIVACKYYDRDGMGDVDPEEPGIQGWRMQLTGYDANGPVGPIVQETGPNGCTSFGDLLPGDYTVTELFPSGGGWASTGPESIDLTIESSLDASGSTVLPVTVSFTNVCFDVADFDTKGYWHNKNGLMELTDADIAHVNGLLPYSAPSSYFDDGDEPFDGYFSDGVTKVAAAMGDGIFQGVAVAPEGSARAEVSQFLVDGNGGGDPREQLAQQLLAFIFNSRHRLDDPGAGIELPDGSLMSAAALIDAAIAAWTSGSPGEQEAIKTLLDALNNDDEVPYVRFHPCAVSYQP